MYVNNIRPEFTENQEFMSQTVCFEPIMRDCNHNQFIIRF